MTRGTTPRMKAKNVMRIGRRRIRAASTAAVRGNRHAAFAQLLREFHDQDGVLGRESHQHDQSHLAKSFCWLRIHWAESAPSNAMGTASRMMKGNTNFHTAPRA